MENRVKMKNRRKMEEVNEDEKWKIKNIKSEKKMTKWEKEGYEEGRKKRERKRKRMSKEEEKAEKNGVRFMLFHLFTFFLFIFSFLSLFLGQSLFVSFHVSLPFLSLSFVPPSFLLPRHLALQYISPSSFSFAASYSYSSNYFLPPAILLFLLLF